MNKSLISIRKALSIVFIILAICTLLVSNLNDINKYAGKSHLGLPYTVDIASVTFILFCIVLSAIFSVTSVAIYRKNKVIILIFLFLLVLYSYKFGSIFTILNLVEQGLLTSTP